MKEVYHGSIHCHRIHQSLRKGGTIIPPYNSIPTGGGGDDDEGRYVLAVVMVLVMVLVMEVVMVVVDIVLVLVETALVMVLNVDGIST